MSKLLGPQKSPFSKNLRQSILAQLQKNKHSSLFQKLKIYDKIVKQHKMRATDQKALTIFQELINDHGYSMISEKKQDEDTLMIMNLKQQKNRIYSNSVYSSPPNPKKEFNEIEDPELFSFSKTRKQLQNKPQQMTQMGTVTLRMHNAKDASKNNSDKPKHHILNLTEPNQRKVSEFNSQCTQQLSNHEANSKQSVPSLHYAAGHLKTFLLYKNAKYLFNLLKGNIKLRKKQFKLKTSEYIHELNLLKKSLSAIKQHNIESKATVQEFRKNKNEQKLLAIFCTWHEYAIRSEDERIREKQIKVKKVLLMKTINIWRFIKNSIIFLQFDEPNQKEEVSISYKEFQHRKSKEIKQKLSRTLKLTTLNYIYNRYCSKNSLKIKQSLLKLNLKRNSFKILIKLILCLREMISIKHEKLVDKTIFKVSSIQFMNRLRKQYHFQNAYWVNMNQTRQLIKFNQASQKTDDELCFQSRLNPKYQKVMFIFEILDCVQHNLNRKGYKFLQNQPNPQKKALQGSQNVPLQECLKNHPAYLQYYMPYKLKKYFQALKGTLLTETFDKMKKIKYKVVGKRVLNNGLLSWYKNRLVREVKDTHLGQKESSLYHYLQNKRIKEFYILFQANIKIKQNELKLQENLYKDRVVDTLMILKTSHISKKYYQKIILQNKLRQKLRTLENYFIEWKLYYAQNVHKRLLEKDVLMMVQRNIIKRLKEQIEQYSLPDKIFRKKCQNLENSRRNDKGEVFITLLRRNWQVKQTNDRLSKAQLKSKQNQIQTFLKQNRKRSIIYELSQNWYQSKLQDQIYGHIGEAYERRLLMKSWLCLKCMFKVEGEEKEKIKQIISKRQRKIKRQVMGRMIQKLIQKIILKRMVQNVKKYWFMRFKSNLFEKPQQQEQKSFENYKKYQ